MCIHSRHICDDIFCAKHFLRLGKQKGTHQMQTYFSADVGRQVVNIVSTQTNNMCVLEMMTLCTLGENLPLLFC